ncbi:MAG TPA: protein-glutamate O-methyltransferase CheR [Candidatus Omnitrophota bacterium]|nr:protein-glutamate O-methyltransferase CheR [Candidatus Omnitrophota bacterium]HQJ15070.1 protein-glutamate O-methyltransferase CheR [Candidatus Omnitrophota bacterium]
MEDRVPGIKSRVKGDEADLAKIIPFVNQRYGIDLAYYRQNFLFRHLRSRMQETGCATSLEYIARMKADPDEFKLFLETLSINVTHFFRDAEVFKAFGRIVIPELVKRKDAGERNCIRIWSAACASGQEAYSLAILFKEAMGDNPSSFRIIGTDIDQEALDRAAKGVYDQRDFRETDKKLLDKYFTLEYNKEYRVNDDIRQYVRFEKNNLITDEPLRHMDVIFCRNVLIYFNRAQQDIIFSKFYAALNNTGFLVVAKVETIWEKDKFESVDLSSKIYRKVAQNAA